MCFHFCVWWCMNTQQVDLTSSYSTSLAPWCLWVGPGEPHRISSLATWPLSPLLCCLWQSPHAGTSTDGVAHTRGKAAVGKTDWQKPVHSLPCHPPVLDHLHEATLKHNDQRCCHASSRLYNNYTHTPLKHHTNCPLGRYLVALPLHRS